jgi:hypothetical protein
MRSLEESLQLRSRKDWKYTQVLWYALCFSFWKLVNSIPLTHSTMMPKLFRKPGQHIYEILVYYVHYTRTLITRDNSQKLQPPLL